MFFSREDSDLMFKSFFPCNSVFRYDRVVKGRGISAKK